jgi:hypothetical protein
MWEPRRLTTLWAFTACYRDSFTLPYPINTSCSYFSPHRYRLTDWLIDWLIGVCEVHIVLLPPFVSPTLYSLSLLCTKYRTSPVTVDARSKAWTVFACSNIGVLGSNATRGMDVCVPLFCVCVVLYVGSCLATVWSPVQGVLPTVYRIKKLKKRPMSTRGVEP